MKALCLFFISILCLLNASAQVGKVELVADILPGPGSCRPEILGTVNGQLVIGEQRISPYLDSIYAIWTFNRDAQPKLIGQRDTNYIYRYMNSGFTYDNTAYFIGSNTNEGLALFKWRHIDSLPTLAIKNFMYNGQPVGAFGTIYSVLPHPKSNLNFINLFVMAYDWNTHMDPTLAHYKMGDDFATIYPAFWQRKLDKNLGFFEFITNVFERQNEIGFYTIFGGNKIPYGDNHQAFCVYDKLNDTIIVHDFSPFGFDHAEDSYMEIIGINSDWFVYIHSTTNNFQCWLHYDGVQWREVPNTRVPLQPHYYKILHHRTNRDFVYYYNNKYWLNVLDSMGNSWLASYDPVSNTTQKLYNFRVPNSALSAFTYYAGDLYFCAETPQPSSNIFVFDGVNPPTLLDNIAQNVNITDARDFYVYNGALYFSATDSLYGHQYGRELFKYTSPKAAIVKDVEPNAIRTLQVYPNPTNGVLQLEGLPTNAGSLQFQLYNTQGQRLAAWEELITDASYTVPTSKLSNLAMGTYFIQVKSTQEATTYLASFVKE